MGRSFEVLATVSGKTVKKRGHAMTTASRWVGVVLTLMILMAGCQRGSKPQEGGGAPPLDPAKLAVETPSPLNGLLFNLSEGSPDAAAVEAVKEAALTPLTEDQVKALLARLPEFKAKPLITDFALREKSLAPPRKGETVLQPWPPTAQAPPVEAGKQALEVLRHAPEGPVPLAPQLSVTFNQPMVALTSHDELAKGAPPVKLTPEPPGNWRWIGTKTVLFDPRGEVSEGSSQQARFPMSTEYKVQVPAGLKSADGTALAKEVNWSFTTPTVTMTGSSPSGGPHALEPLMWATFDQDIDPAKVLAKIKVEGGGPVALRLATPEEVKNSGLDPKTPKRWVAFKATAPLKAATSYTVSVGAGTPSAEGPLTTKSAQTFSFKTYDKFAVARHGCGGGDCPPLSPLHVVFNNPIDAEKFDPSTVKVTPEIPGMKIEAHHDSLLVRGETKGKTTYKVTLPASLPDSFGQTLGVAEELTFNTGSAQPSLNSPGGMLVTLDPNSSGSLPLYVINHKSLKVRIHSVEPTDWPEFQQRLNQDSQEKPFVPPGQEVFNGTVQTGAKTDELTEVRIDLKSALTGGKGMAVVMVETPGNGITDWWRRRSERSVKWVQATDLGVDAAVDQQVMRVMTTSLKGGGALGGVKLSLLGVDGLKPASSATSNEGGAATLPLPELASGLLLAEKGDDQAILPQNADYWGYGSWRKEAARDQLRWFVLDDRKMYRPDEKVSLKGWVRRWQGGPKGDVVGLKGEISELTWQLSDSQGNKVLEGKTPVSKDGSFSLQMTLPKTMNLGRAYLSLTSSSSEVGSSHAHDFEVQEFRRPEFEVTAEGPSDAVIGGDATATVKARYYAGGGLPGAPVEWTVSASPGSYAPPGHDEFSFGVWTPWWSMDDYGWDNYRGYPGRVDLDGGEEQSKNFSSQTDVSGDHHLKIDLLSVDPLRPTVVKAEASVSDVNRQAWNASTSILVHPSDYYVGLRSEKTFVEKGDPLEIELLACHRDGKVVEDVPVEIAVWRNESTYEKGQYKENKVDLQTETLTSGSGPSKVQFATKNGGDYTVKARLVDPQGRANESTLTVWVTGQVAPPARGLEQQKLTLVPNQKEYKVGETAEILVQAPFAPAEGLVTWRRSGIVHSERVSLKEASTVLKVPIVEARMPNLQVQVDLVGAPTTVSGKKQPAYATGAVNLSIPPLTRTLAVEVKPVHPATDPGARTSIEVVVKGPDGKPVTNAEVSLFAVDESVLALTGYQFPNPLEVFYSERSSDTTDLHSRQFVVLTKMEEVAASESFDERGRLRNDGLRGGGGNAPGPSYNNYDGIVGTLGGDALKAGAEFSAYAAESRQSMPAPSAAPREAKRVNARSRSADKAEMEAGPSQPSTPIAVRTDFNPTALFAPLVKTDASGKASVPFKLPDNLTRYRLVALATDGGQRFGKGESALTARLPLMVRPSAPRFLNFGDTFELPVVLQNQTDQELDVQVAARSVNLKLTGAQGYSLKIPANDRVEVRFPAATDRVGKADLQVGATSGATADAAEVSLPVWTPATTEAFATYGEIDDGAIGQPVKPPSDVFPQFGGLEITTTSTALQSLTDAFLYLTTYPFDCSEQVSSRLLGIAALRDVLWAFKAEGVPSANELNAQVARDMERLALLQSSNGGFGFWSGSGETWPFISVHVGHALARAKDKGYKVPETLLNQSKAYLGNVESYIPGWYHEDCKRVIRAYALYVRNRLGESDPARLDALINEAGGVTKLPLEAMAFVYNVIGKDTARASQVAEIRKYLANHITETAGNAHFVAGYEEEAGYVILASDRRVDGLLLEAMIKDQPKSDLIPKLARGLLAGRDRGRWSNTQDNCFVLLALDLYFQTYEKVTPDFIARAWLGDGFVGEQAFKGREVDYKSVKVPMSYLADKGEQTLTLAKEGKGRLYYRLGMDYAPTSLKMDPADHGFAVERVYEGVDKPEDVKQDEDGTWRIKAGAKVRVKLTMVATARRYHVALVDPMPAGLEALNPALAVTGTVPNDPSAQASRGPWWYWQSTWYEHQNMRDERVEAFTSLLWEGVYSYSYTARATTPGSFVVPPTKAEEMYAPETFGRGASDRVVVE